MYPYIFSLEIPWLNITLEPRFYGLFYAVAVLIGGVSSLTKMKQ